MPERLVEDLWVLDLGWSAPLGANAYLIDDGEVTLVDAGFPVNATRIREEVAATGHAVVDIDRVLLTHYDLDHVGGLGRLVPDLDAPVYLGRADLDLLSGGGSAPLLHHKGLFHRGLRRLHRIPPSLQLVPVDDRDRIGGFTAFHTPGHNPGHVIYVHEAAGTAFLGDLVWEDGGRLTLPVWLDSYDMGELKASIDRIAADVPPFEVACMGHGRPLRSGGSTALRELAGRLDDETGSVTRLFPP